MKNPSIYARKRADEKASRRASEDDAGTATQNKRAPTERKRAKVEGAPAKDERAAKKGERATAEGERLQKAMARAGIASRRQCEVFIAEGRVKVNGRVVTEMGTRVRPGRDRIEFDGRIINPDAPTLRYYVFYKPTGYLSTVRDPHGRPTVMQLVPTSERLFPVGRLDYNSEGLMLLTNDGPLAHRLLHPRFEHEREYLVLVPGTPDDTALQRLEEGVMVGDPPMLSQARAEVLGRRWRWRDEANVPDTTWLRMVLKEGHKREIRYMLLEVGFQVQRLIRVRFDQLIIGDLKVGEGRWLTPREAADLRRAVGLPAEPRPMFEYKSPRPPAAGSGASRDSQRKPRTRRSPSTNASRRPRTNVKGKK